MIDQVEIRKILPHRFPMLLVDEVTSINPGNNIVAIKNVSYNEPCFLGISDIAESAYAYPSSLIIESFGQSAAVLYSISLQKKEENIDDSVMLLGSIGNFSFHGEVFPGETLEHHVFLDKLLSNTAICRGKVLSHNKLVAKCKKMIILQRAAQVLSSKNTAVC